MKQNNPTLSKLGTEVNFFHLVRAFTKTKKPKNSTTNSILNEKD